MFHFRTTHDEENTSQDGKKEISTQATPWDEHLLLDNFFSNGQPNCSHERQVDALQADVFDLRRELDKERSTKKRIHENSFANFMRHCSILAEKAKELEEAMLNEDISDMNTSEAGLWICASCGSSPAVNSFPRATRAPRRVLQSTLLKVRLMSNSASSGPSVSSSLWYEHILLYTIIALHMRCWRL